MLLRREHISEQIRIPPLQTVLLFLPFNKLPCPQNVDCMTLGYSLGNLSMSGTSTSITPRCFFFSVLQAAKPWNTFHGFRTKQAWKKTDGEGQQNKAIPIRSLILESSSVFLSCDERALSTLKKKSTLHTTGTARTTSALVQSNSWQNDKFKIPI